MYNKRLFVWFNYMMMYDELYHELICFYWVFLAAISRANFYALSRLSFHESNNASVFMNQYVLIGFLNMISWIDILIKHQFTNITHRLNTFKHFIFWSTPKFHTSHKNIFPTKYTSLFTNSQTWVMVRAARKIANARCLHI